MRHKQKYPISKMCAFFDVSRSGYYDWLNRAQKPDKDEFLRELIIECQDRNNKTYGYRRVVLWLMREFGLIANHKAVLRVMNKYNLLSVIRRKKKNCFYTKSLLKYPNVLNRNFKANTPNQKWVTDITYIHTAQGTLFLSAIKDLFDNFIVGYKVAKSQHSSLVINTIKQAKSKEKVADGLVLHSDQGYQYTSNAYFYLTKEYNIMPSMSRPGTPLDNACAENFFSILKTECINRVELKTFSEAETLIDDYIFYYNYERIQLKSRMTPYEKRSMAA